MILVCLQQEANAGGYSHGALQLDELAQMIEAAPPSWQWCIRPKFNDRRPDGTIRAKAFRPPPEFFMNRDRYFRGSIQGLLYKMNLPNVTWISRETVTNDRNGSIRAQIQECQIHISHSSSSAKLALELGKPAIFMSIDGLTKYPELVGKVPHVEVKDLKATIARLL